MAQVATLLHTSNHKQDHKCYAMHKYFGQTQICIITYDLCIR